MTVLSSRRRRNVCGAALVESALTLPLFLACIIGIVSYGDMLSSVSWLSRTTFEAARAAGESQRSLATARAVGVAQDLFEIQEGGFAGGRIASHQVYTPEFNDENRTVSVRLRLEVNPLIPYGPSSIVSRVVSPILTLGVVSDTGFGEFSDGPCVSQGSSYDASGNCVAVPPAATPVVNVSIPPSKEGDVRGGVAKNDLAATNPSTGTVLDDLPDLDADGPSGGTGTGNTSPIGHPK